MSKKLEIKNLAPHLSSDKTVTLATLVESQLRLNRFPLEVALMVHSLFELAKVPADMTVNLKDYEAILIRNAQDAGLPITIVRQEAKPLPVSLKEGH